MYNLANRLFVNPNFTWIGSGKRFRSKSSLDYFFCNFDYFDYIEFKFNSYSDHKSVAIGRKGKFKYQSPKWKTFLFKNKKFLEVMKEQTEWFLKQNSDSSNENLSNVTLDDLSFTQAKNQNTGVMFNLIQHLKQEHDKFYSKLRQQEFQKTKTFDEQMEMLYKKIENDTSNDYLLQINELILTQQQYFKQLVNYRAETYYMRNLILDGMPNSLTYQNVKPCKKRSYNLIIEDELNFLFLSLLSSFGSFLAKLHQTTSDAMWYSFSSFALRRLHLRQCGFTRLIELEDYSRSYWTLLFNSQANHG